MEKQRSLLHRVVMRIKWVNRMLVKCIKYFLAHNKCVINVTNFITNIHIFSFLTAVGSSIRAKDFHPTIKSQNNPLKTWIRSCPSSLVAFHRLTTELGHLAQASRTRVIWIFPTSLAHSSKALPLVCPIPLPGMPFPFLSIWPLIFSHPLGFNWLLHAQVVLWLLCLKEALS